MDRFFLKTQLKLETFLPLTKRPLPHGLVFLKNQFYSSISDFFFCHEKVRSVLVKRRTIIRIFDTLFFFFDPIRQKKSTFVVKNQIYTSILAIFPSDFLVFCPKSPTKISSFYQK